MPSFRLVVIALMIICCSPLGAARESPTPHSTAACEPITIVIFSNHQCHGEAGEDGCHGVVLIAFANDSCRGGDATSRHKAGNGCEDSLVINIEGEGNCRGGDG